MIEVKSEQEIRAFGARLGGLLKGGEVLELVGDVGAGKTTLTRGIAEGLGVDETVQSPSFTISRVYDGRDGVRLAHYDFYRIAEAGIMSDELDETLHDDHAVTVIEWSDTVRNILPDDRLTVTITTTGDDSRHIELSAGGEASQKLQEALDDSAH